MSERIVGRGGKKTHGMSYTPEYRAWEMMRARCGRPSCKEYPDYGGRGITVCDRWRESFQNFYADMGPRPSPKHSLDRINNDGNYEPGNCRWATTRQQTRNTRRSRFLTAFGKTQTLADWVEETGSPEQTLSNRLKRPHRWTVEQALTR